MPEKRNRRITDGTVCLGEEQQKDEEEEKKTENTCLVDWSFILIASRKKNELTLRQEDSFNGFKVLFLSEKMIIRENLSRNDRKTKFFSE